MMIIKIYVTSTVFLPKLDNLSSRKPDSVAGVTFGTEYYYVVQDCQAINLQDRMSAETQT